MAFKINDERAPLDQFLQGESVRAYEFLGSHFVNWDGPSGRCFQSMGTERIVRFGGR